MNFKKITIVLSLIAFMVIGVAATSPKEEPNDPERNLKVLPKDISKEELHNVMEGFNDALAVKCNFCHAPSKDPNERRPDFASDDKKEKNIARKMLLMTKEINKQYFSFEKNEQGEQKEVVTCGTCHHGNKHPEFIAPPHENMGPPPGAPMGPTPPPPHN